MRKEVLDKEYKTTLAEAESLLFDIGIEEEIVPIEEYVLVDENLKDEEIQCEKEIKEIELSSESEERKFLVWKHLNL